MDYMVLVNRDHPLPAGWTEELCTVKSVNSAGNEVETEQKAYEAYLLLKKDLADHDGIFLELDSALRSIDVQQEIMDSFTVKYGKEAAAKMVAPPGCSEQHTGLALDLNFRLKNDDGSFRNVCSNEDLEKYPEIWEKIHARLARYGFILRYPEGKEQLTGYIYEPWHIRYLDNPEAAEEFMSKHGMTMEEWPGTAGNIMK